ncbi:hypothetical protein C8F01DRAFT_1238733, partial [Mycena amicta]
MSDSLMRTPRWAFADSFILQTSAKIQLYCCLQQNLIPRPRYLRRVEACASLYRAWDVMGFRFNHHFFLFFELEPDDFSSFSSPLSSPPTESPRSAPSPPSSAATSRRARNKSPYTNHLSNAGTSMSRTRILALCTAFVPDFESLEPRAVFNPCTKGASLTSLLSSHHAMESILSKLFGAERPKPAFTKSFVLHGTSSDMSVGEVLAAFNWVQPTFVHKRSKFEQARTTALKEWTVPIP